MTAVHDPTVRVIVCGSRRWHDRQRIADRLADVPPAATVVVGYNPAKDTPKGVDRIAYQEAQKLGLLVEPHPADWDRFGKRAGLVRNEEMARLGAVLCLAFWDGQSNGTRHMMETAADHGIPVEVVRK